LILFDKIYIGIIFYEIMSFNFFVKGEIYLNLKLNQKLIFLFVLIISFASIDYVHFKKASAQYSVEQEAAFIAAVDLSLVYQFHPLMQYYDPNLKLFIRPFKVNGSEQLNIAINERGLEFKTAEEKYMPEIKKTGLEISNIQAQIKEIENKRDNEVSQLNEKYKTLINDSGTAAEKSKKQSERMEKITAIQQKYTASIDSLNAKQKPLQDNCNKLIANIKSVYYLNSSESRELIRKINQEVVESIKYVAGKQGVKAVINISNKAYYNAKLIEKNFMDGYGMNSNSGTASNDFNNIVPRPDYAKLLTLYEPLKENNNEIHGINISRTDKEVKLKQLKSAWNETNRNFEGLFIDDALLYGGIDITSSVISYIYLKHGVPKDTALVIEEIFNDGGHLK